MKKSVVVITGVSDNGVAALIERSRGRIPTDLQDVYVFPAHNPYEDAMVAPEIKTDRRKRDGKYGRKWGNK